MLNCIQMLSHSNPSNLFMGSLFSCFISSHCYKSLEHSGVPTHCFISIMYRTVNMFLHCDYNMTGEPRVTMTGDSGGVLYYFVRNCITSYRKRVLLGSLPLGIHLSLQATTQLCTQQKPNCCFSNNLVTVVL